METKRELARCARWFVAYVKLGAVIVSIIAFFGLVGTFMAAFNEGLVAGLGIAGITVIFVLLALFYFWVAKMTEQGRRKGAQILLCLQLVGLAGALLRLGAVAANLTGPQWVGQIFAFALSGLFIWWFYAVVQSLPDVKEPEIIF